MIPEDNARQAIGLAGRAPGQPCSVAGAFALFAAYLRQRAADDRHLHGIGLHREVTVLGYPGSYPAFTRDLREHGIDTGCRTCRPRQTRRPPPRQSPPQLPFRVAPLAGETISSYLARLAAASHLPLGDITGCLPPWFASRATACDDLNSTNLARPGDAARLAALTGISENALRHALPALNLAFGRPRPPVRAARACQRCAARHGQHDPVPVHYPAHQRTCPQHRVWLGRAAHFDIAALPEITAAARKASQLARRHGITMLVLAEAAARQNTITDPEARRRAAALALSVPGLNPGHPDTAEAAAYPETIKTAAAILHAPGALPDGPQ
jgi:hypothetical protein